jgi:hypothetical protein
MLVWYRRDGASLLIARDHPAPCAALAVRGFTAPGRALSIRLDGGLDVRRSGAKHVFHLFSVLMKMEPISAQGWFVKCALGLVLPLLVYAAIVAAGPKAPPLPTARDGALEVLDRYTQGPVPEIVLVGSSFTARLKEEYFDATNLKVLGLAGGSSITALKVLVGRERLPKIVLIEMNVLERSEDPALVQRFTGSANASTLPHPIRSALAFYEHWLHAPPDRRQAGAMVAAMLQARPSVSTSTGLCENGAPRRQQPR